MAERARATNGETPKRQRKSKAPKPGKPGHNSGEVPVEVYERHLDLIDTKRVAYEKAAAEAKQKKGELASAFKAAKGDGCNIDAIKAAHALTKRDLTDVVQDHHDIGRVLRILGSPLGTQFKLFADGDLPKPVSAVLAGQQAGKQGAPRDGNPHPPGSDEFVQYDNAWLEEQTKIAASMGDDAPLNA
jgi:hypothetical protein